MQIVSWNEPNASKPIIHTFNVVSYDAEYLISYGAPTPNYFNPTQLVLHSPSIHQFSQLCFQALISVLPSLFITSLWYHRHLQISRYSKETGVWVLNQFLTFVTFCFLRLVQILLTYYLLHSYLTGVNVAQLRWHLSNINVIQRASNLRL